MSYKKKPIEFQSIFDEQQKSIGENYLENYHQKYTTGDYLSFQHNNINLEHFIKPKHQNFTDLLDLDGSSKRYRSQIDRPLMSNKLNKRKSS
jgi:hypothetical protein